MGNLKQRLTDVAATLQQLDIQSTYKNMNGLLGSVQEILRIREEIPDNIMQLMQELEHLRKENAELKADAEETEEDEEEEDDE